MLVIILYWIVLSLVFVSFGDVLISLWNRLTGKKERFKQREQRQGYLNYAESCKTPNAIEQYSLVSTFLLGFAFIGMLACLCSLFIPLNIYVTAIVIAISILYWIVNRRKLTNILSKIYSAYRNMSWFWRIVSGLVLLLVLFYSLQMPVGFDMNLYHIQSMLWSEQYSVVPGLGNLHGRLAFNSNSLLLYTLFFFHPDYITPNFAINGLLLFVFLFWIIKTFVKGNSLLISILFSFLLLVFCFFTLQGLTSSSTDLFVNILVAYVFLSFVLEGKNRYQSNYLLYLLIPLFCMTLKVSAVFVVLLFLPYCWNMIKQKQYKILVFSLLLGSLVVIPWIARFVIMSGYLIYPFSSIDIFSFDWKMPIEEVIAEKNSITAWARVGMLSADVVLSMPICEWGKIWLINHPRLYLTSYMLAGFSSLLFLYNYFVRKKKDSAFLIAWIVASVGAVFGFISAPDPRFFLAFVLCVGALPILHCLKGASVPIKLFNVSILHRISGVVALVGLLYLCTYGVLNLKPSQKDSYMTLLYKPQDFFTQKKQIDPTFRTVIVNELPVYAPVGDFRCFDYCLPCTPMLDSRLELRGDTYQDGFRKK